MVSLSPLLSATFVLFLDDNLPLTILSPILLQLLHGWLLWFERDHLLADADRRHLIELILPQSWW